MVQRNGAQCRTLLHSMVVISMIAPSVNVLRRTRRKPSTIRGAAPDVVIGQSTAARAGARPYQLAPSPQKSHAGRSYELIPG
jgi:hypothetical protein